MGGCNFQIPIFLCVCVYITFKLIYEVNECRFNQPLKNSIFFALLCYMEIKCITLNLSDSICCRFFSIPSSDRELEMCLLLKWIHSHTSCLTICNLNSMNSFAIWYTISELIMSYIFIGWKNLQNNSTEMCHMCITKQTNEVQLTKWWQLCTE